ncbi:unnamed protein product [Amoebophrya sp. A25]|nr:unnamed protein product [Amoebophrya sp. A25]|eukprot:GSA25T00015901001.1
MSLNPDPSPYPPFLIAQKENKKKNSNRHPGFEFDPAPDSNPPPYSDPNSRGPICWSTADGPNRVGPGWTAPNIYEARESGKVHDTTKPPPGLCLNCSKRNLPNVECMHWRKDCPHRVSSGSTRRQKTYNLSKYSLW